MALDFSSLWMFHDAATSERRFRDLLATLSVACERAETLTQIARAQGLQRAFDAAHATLDTAELLLADSTPATLHAKVRVLLERGRVMNSSGDPRGAAAWFEQAWMVARDEHLDALAVDAAHMLGIVQPNELGAEWNQRALDLATHSLDPDARRWTASLRNNIGWWFHDRGRFDEALAMFEQARSDREAQPARSPLLIARWAVARCLRSLGRFDEAFTQQQALLDEHARDGTSDGYVHEEIAECLLALGHHAAARDHFKQALQMLAPNGQSTDVPADRITRWRECSR